MRPNVRSALIPDCAERRLPESGDRLLEDEYRLEVCCQQMGVGGWVAEAATAVSYVRFWFEVRGEATRRVFEAGDAMRPRLRAKLVSHLRRSRFFLRFFPGLPAWASLCRAYGAGAAACVRRSDGGNAARRV